MKGTELTTVFGLVVVAVVVLCLAWVIIAALEAALEKSNGNFEGKLSWRGFVELWLKITGRTKEEEDKDKDRKHIREKRKNARSWFFRHWRAALITALVLVVVGLPVWWWYAQPAAWRMLLSYELNETFSLLRHSAHDPVNITRGHATLDRITRMLEIRTDNLAHDQYNPEEIWIVDHYWQYWNTTNLRDYLTANKIFVAHGGKIHRMFLLSDQEMRDPEVQTMLQAQCQIGKLGANQTGNGFELWRADPERIKDREEYGAVARAFQQLPSTDKNFNNYDVVQFNDTLYYSSDFSTDYRVMGSSTWIFEPAQVSKIDLRPLFKKSIAQRISCDQSRPVMSTMKTGGALE
jgi:hypothetical protein